MDGNIRSALNNLQLRKKDMEHYASIINRVWNIVVSADMDFQREFTYFYRVRRDGEWREVFYGLFEQCKKITGVSFEYILREIYKRTGRIEASFSSKMLAALYPQMPIWDSIVLSKLRIKPSAYQDKEKRLTEAVKIYQEIAYWYKGFLQSEGSAEVLNAFDEAFPEYQNFTPVKKVDFLIWGGGDTNLFSQKIIEINGCVEVPPVVTEDEFMDKFIGFIESNHWYFGGGVKEV